MKRALKRLRRSWEFFRALVRGARTYIRHGWPVLPAAWGVLRSVLARQSRTAPFAVRLARHRGCRHCVLYNPAYRTCGDGGALDFGWGPIPNGCQCWVPLKAADLENVCFLTSIHLPGNWPK